MHFVTEPETMQERCGDGTEAKLCNLINQLEELLLLIKEGSKVVIRSQSQESDNMLDTRDSMRPKELSKPIQAGAEVPPSGHVVDTMESGRHEAAKPPEAPKLKPTQRVQKDALSMTGPATSPKTWRRHAVNKGVGDPSEFAGPRDHTVLSRSNGGT